MSDIVERLQPLVDGFDAFLNEPTKFEDQTRVRDYRHTAYSKWSVLRELLSSAMGGQADEIERLHERCEAYKGQIEAGSKMIKHLRAQVQVLRGALEPFADLALDNAPWYAQSDDTRLCIGPFRTFQISVGDLRRARALRDGGG